MQAHQVERVVLGEGYFLGINRLRFYPSIPGSKENSQISLPIQLPKGRVFQKIRLVAEILENDI